MNFKSPKFITQVLGILLGGSASINHFISGINLPAVEGNEFEALLAGFISMLISSFLKK